MLVTPDGRRYWPFFGATFYREIAPLMQYKFIQTSRDAIEARLVVERPLTQSEQERTAQADPDDTALSVPDRFHLCRRDPTQPRLEIRGLHLADRGVTANCNG